MNSTLVEIGLRRTLLASCIGAALIGMRTGPVQAQSEAPEEITVTGTRIIRSGMVTPVPVTAVQASELQNMSAGTMYDALTQLPPFFNNQSPEQVNGGQNSGGSNLNLRGAGVNRTLVLLDGRRIVPTNRFGAVDVGMFPEELLRSVETVTGGASASYGTDAVAGVVNFILDTSFEGTEGHAQVGETGYGDGENYEVGFAFGHGIGERGHLIASLETYHIDAISSLESLKDRDFIRNVARVTNPSFTTNLANGARNLTLPWVSPTNWNQTGIINQPGSSLNKLVFNPDGTVTPLQYSGVGAIDTGCNCQASATPSYGSDTDNEVAAGNERTNLFLHYEHELNDNVKFFAQVLAGENEVTDRREGISFVLTWAPRIFADNAYLPANIRQTMLQPGQASLTPGTSYPPSVGFAVFTENGPNTPLGDARQITKNELTSGTVGFEVELDRDGFLDGWHMQAYYQYGKNDQAFDTDNGVRVDRIPLALDAVVDPSTGNIVCNVALVDPVHFGDCVPMNVFGGVQNISPAAARYIVDDYKHAIQHTTQDLFDFVLTGDLFDGWGGGAISAAFGASYRSEDLDQKTPDPTDEFPATPSGVLLSDLGLLAPGVRGLIPQHLPGGIPGVRNVPAGFTGDANSSSVTFSSLRAIQGGYDVRELFSELNIPIIANAGWANQFDITAAARWADYSGSGEIWAWKYGLNWQINDVLRFRATQSRDVRAASLRERFDQTRGGVNVNDPADPNPVTGAPTPIATASFSGGNPNVNPEEADTTTAGFIFQPKSVEGLSFSFDWYYIDINDAIAQLSSQLVVNGCFNGDQSLCPFVHRDPTTNLITRVDNLFINLARQVIEGVDFETNYAFGPFNLRMFATRMIENSIQTQGGPVDDRAGDIGGPTAGFPELKVTANFSWERGPFSLFAQERYIDGGKLDRTLVQGVDIDDNTVDSIYYTDLGLRLKLGVDKSWEVFANINNLFDEDPHPTAQILGRAGVNEFNFNSQIYDLLGRTFVVGARLQF